MQKYKNVCSKDMDVYYKEAYNVIFLSYNNFYILNKGDCLLCEEYIVFKNRNTEKKLQKGVDKILKCCNNVYMFTT